MGLFSTFGRTSRTSSSPARGPARGTAGRARHDARTARRSLASRLAAWAGLTGGQGQVDTLEKRELLFTLAITQDNIDPTTGLGTARAYFGYVLPFLASDYEIPDLTTQTEVENFNQAGYGAVGSNFVFAQSNIRLVHNIQPAGDIAVTSDVGNVAEEQERYLRVDANQVGEFFEFRPRQQGNANIARPTDQASVTIRAAQNIQSQSDQSGLDTNAFRVSLLFNGEVLQTFTPQQVRNALLGGGNPTLGTGTFVFTEQDGRLFDTIRFELISPFSLPGSSAFEVDDVAFRFRNSLFSGLTDERVFGSVVVLSGPVGASVTIRDLYQREMIRTIALGRPQGADVLLVDLDDDGIPDFNDGIGSISFNNVDSRTSFSMWGGTITSTTNAQPTDDFFENGFALRLVTDVAGIANDFEQANFGYVFNATAGGNDDFDVAGLPEVVGSVVIGSPYVRNPANYLGDGPFGSPVFAADDFIVQPDDDTSFIRADQGIFVPNGQSMNSLLIHGILHGNSQFTGAVNRLTVSYLVGSVTVAGDLGSLNTQTDVGAWAIEPDFDFTNPVQIDAIYRTEGSITVGRTVGEIAIGGRGQADITVLGDLNSPVTRPARDVFNYTEREYVDPIPVDAENLQVIRELLYIGTNFTQGFVNLGTAGTSAEALAVDGASAIRNNSQAALFGEGFLRNDTLMTAEFIGSTSTAVRIRGDLSGRNPILDEDAADVYSFVWDGTSEIVVQAVDNRQGFGVYARIVDAQGRTIGAPVSPDRNTVLGDPNQRTRFVANEFRVSPREGAGLYYLIVADPSGAAETDGATVPYSLFISGLASTTFGSYRTGAASGVASANGGLANAITLLSGSMGAIQVGTGFGDDSGDDAASQTLINTELDVDNAASLHGGSFSIAGDLWALIAGGDIGAPVPEAGISVIQMDIGGRVGLIATGLSPLYGNGPRAFQDGGGTGGGAQGDVNGLVMRVRGGGVANIDIGGAIGFDQDPEGADRRQVTGFGFSLTTGDNVRGIAGDIGMIRVGFHVVGSNIGNRPFNITTSDNSTIGAILISQDAYEDANTLSGITAGPIGLTTGRNSDIRFFDVPEVDLVSADATFPLTLNQPREFIDDAGGRFTISIVGDGITNPNDLVRLVPVDGGQGVAVAQIIADLTGGRTLRVTSLGNTSGGGGSGGVSRDLISLGRIRVTGDANSRIEFGGQGEIDVYRIEVTGQVQAITNTTIGGDILAIDAEGLDVVEVEGDLGRTQLVPFGPRSIAPFPGIDGGGLNTTLGGPIGTPTAVNDQPLVDPNVYGGGVYRPSQNEDTATGTGFRDDVGSAVDGRIEGVVVRGGNVSRVAARGAIRNVVLQGATSILGEVRVNTDGITRLDDFEGILGAIYAFRVATVDVGDGIAASTSDNPIGKSGVFAADDIGTVTGPTSITVPGGGVGGQASIKPTRISGAIIAGNVLPLNQGPITLLNGFTYDFTEDGITNVLLPGGEFIDSFIASDTLDVFWESFAYNGETGFFYGDLGLIDVTNATFSRNQLRFGNLDTFDGDGTFFDASRIELADNLGTMNVRGFANSTLLGTLREFAPTAIDVEETIGTINVELDAQDVSIGALGEVTGSINARSFVRSFISVNGILRTVNAREDFRGSEVQAGQLDTLTIGRNIASSEVNVSGQLGTLSIGDRAINTSILVSGPDGRINGITARNGFSGSINSSGTIGPIAIANGDFDAVVTTTEPDADLTSITASRDVIASGFIAANIGTITAGRHIGALARSGQSLVAQGNIATISAPAGTLYADLRAGGAITTARLGGAPNKPENDQTGRGSLVAFNGITTVTINGDFGGDILSYGNGLGTITITNGSFLPGRTIAAYRGSILSLTITGGDLLGNVYADDDITSLVVNGAGLPFGNVGVDNAKTPFTVVDARRNQLPQGVAAGDGISGSLIQAGRDITSITISGSVFESGFHAVRSIVNIAIGGRVANNSNFGAKGSFFAAGDSITRVSTGVNFADTVFVAGLTSLGADNRPGGFGENEDTIKAGNIGTIVSPQGAFGVTFLAGVEAGPDGVYGDDPGTFGNESDDDALALGVSSVGNLNIGGTLANVQVIADVIPSSIANDSRFAVRRTPGQLADYVLDPGTGFAGTSFAGTRTVTVGGATYTLSFTGPGEAFFSFGTPTGVASTGLGAPDFTITLRNTGAGSALAVSSSTGTLDNLHIWTNNNASLGTLTLSGLLTGNSTILVDGGVGAVAGGTTSSVSNAFNDIFQPRFDIGGDVSTFAFAGLAAARVNTRAITTLTITGDFGGATGSSELRAQSLGTVTIGGALRGLLSSQTTITGLTVTGAGDRATVRGARGIGPIAFGGQIGRSTISSGRDIGAVTIGGQMFDSTISAGVDLGRDAFFDGTGADADSLRSGSIASVVVNGDFRESDITAGFLRGNDRFFGTTDDRIAGGRGNIGPVTINGTQTGSTRAGETYRIAASGSLGIVTLGGIAFTGNRGNFGTLTSNLAPRAVEVETLRVVTESFVPSAIVEFNQPMDRGTLDRSLSVSEVRGQGEVELRLVQGRDYTTNYIEATNAYVITFARRLLEANLPVVPGTPGPGVYRIRIDSDIARGRLQDAGFDGDADGLTEAQDDYVGGVVVGDAGDKIEAFAGARFDPAGRRLDFYAPANLNFILDDADAPDALPEVNRSITVDGFIGDHPDNNTTSFRLGGDVDLYRITLEAGQILRLSPLSGGASAAQYFLLDANGEGVSPRFEDGNVVRLPTADPGAFERSQQLEFLIKTTGNYIISVGDASNVANTSINNPAQTVPGTIGNYSFSVEVFDDGDSGFTSPTNAGNGNTLIPAPRVIDFAGNDGNFGTPDDIATIQISNFTYTLDRGADGAANTGDDIVRGEDGQGATATRQGGRTVETVRSAIGTRGNAGVPNVFQSDVDVFHLNNRQPIAPGTKMRLTVRLSQNGSDLGSLSIPTTEDLRGFVQFGLFETTRSIAVDDANLVFSSTDFRANGGASNTIVGQSASTTYGFDANGDFFIDFVTPEAQGTTNGAGTFAAYIQGIINADYEIEVVTEGTGTIQRRAQNFYIETNGGTINWLEAGQRITRLTGVDFRTLGISGSVANGDPAGEAIIDNMVAGLNNLFRGAGLNVTFSTNAGDFEFGEFSTIYLTSSTDPVNTLFGTFNGFGALSSDASFNALFEPTNPYGVSQRSDPFNTRLDDEAVVFIPSLSLIGRTPSLRDIDLLTENLTAAVARRAGELMGTRITTLDGVNNLNNFFDVFASNSVDFARNFPDRAFDPNYAIYNFSRSLSGNGDSTVETNFFLGSQNSAALLRSNVAPRV